MMNFKRYNQEAVQYFGATGTAKNDAKAYGVTVEANQSNVWRVALVHHLLPAENRGKHNVYIEVLDEDGQRVNGLEAEWTWKGRKAHEPANPVELDKGNNEPAGNLPIFTNQYVSVWINGESSDKVHGMHTMHADEGDGNTFGHHSFYVVFQRDGSGGVAPPVDDSIEERLTRLEERIADLAPLERWARGLAYKRNES